MKDSFGTLIVLMGAFMTCGDGREEGPAHQRVRGAFVSHLGFN